MSDETAGMDDLIFFTDVTKHNDHDYNEAESCCILLEMSHFKNMMVLFTILF